ncbi:MAG: exosortase/archaeosortase family protein [Acidimicrobiales bacterium]
MAGRPAAPVLARRPLARAAAVAAIVGVIAAVVANAQQIQVAEAAASRPILAVVLGQAVHVPGSNRVFYPNHTGVGLRSLQITSLCSVTPLILPILALGVLAALQRRFSPLRVVVVTGSLVLGLVVVNIARIAMICIATRHWGPGGFELTHRVVGSALIMAAMAASLVAGARLLSSQASR